MALLRRRGAGRALVAATALTTALTVAIAGSDLQQPLPLRLSSVASPLEDPADFDPQQAAAVRTDQCRLNYVLRKGGTAMKAVARGGLAGTDEDLHTAANERFWGDTTPLHAAYQTDWRYALAKGEELSTDRQNAWQSQIDLAGFPLVPGYQNWPPGHPGDDEGDIFNQTGFSGWIADQFWTSESSFYENVTPRAGREAADAATKVITSRYSPNGYEDAKDWDAWTRMNFPSPEFLYADDIRLVLQYGGFPTSAPDPDSTEFRIDVENLKARFASCTSHNPPDPHGVLGVEVAVASAEWQDELRGQRLQRDTILAAEAQANKALQTAAQAMGEALGQSMIASRLSAWRAYWTTQNQQSDNYPTAAQFAEVDRNIQHAQGRAGGRLYIAGRAMVDANAQVAKVDKAQAEAYAIADAAGLPRGRGLMYGQQAAQITKASAAAVAAATKSTETALHATRASAADAKTLSALAMTQAHAAKADFRREAAEEAARQAKAAAEGAAAQAAKASENAAKAKAAATKAKEAEAKAKTAAEAADAKRIKAQAEAAYAKSQKELADAERGKASAAETKARSERQTAADQLAAAQSAGSTAASKKDAALAAELRASKARDGAREAELRRDSLVAKAEAVEALLAAVDGTEAASEAREAATRARTAANGATAAAVSARSAAGEATEAATNAREAATRAEGAARRAQALADGAKRDVAVTESAMRTAHAAAAEAIDAAGAAKGNAAVAKAEAETAQLNARKAKADAAIARSEAILAGREAVRAAGFAYATAQAAKAAGESALKVIKPANDAIELGAPYQDTDASAGLAVLTGQAAKTAAAQQAALAKAKADQASAAAKLAQKIAAEASADAKAAAAAAADAAVSSAQALASAEAAQKSSSAADASAKAAQQSEANTVKYHQDAVEDAAAAQASANTASDYAAEADAAATDAEKDAASARLAATEAEKDAAGARDTATRAESDATAAEEAAARARESAEDAQTAADRTETSGSNEQISQGVTTGIGGVWAVLDRIEYIGEPQNVVKDNCNPIIHVGDCRITATVTYKSHVDLFMCLAAPETYAGSCPRADTFYLGPEVTDAKSQRMSITLTMAQFNSGIDPVDVLLGDFIGCAKLITPGGSGGSWGDCAWAASWFVAGPLFRAGKAAVTALDAALKTGVGFMDAYRALRTVGLTEAAIQGILSRIFQKAGAACTVASPAASKVVGAKAGLLSVASADDDLIKKCQAILDDIVKDGERIVLGINPHSDDLVKITGGRTFNNKDFGIQLPEGMGMGVRPIWTVGVERAVSNGTVKISVSLDGVSGAKTADEALNAHLKRGETIGPTDWETIRRNGTAWEMTKLRSSVRVGGRGWKSIDWWMTNSEGKVVQVYPEKWKYANGTPVAD
ncbi:polymorphic toxin type 27 domain-containing protein [Streptomyces sp. NPDC087908]|uniref:polymorphic toxin type 27 domain-containing protein n=1 Tax=Streptomyces sp. NPDC087908 TaxID=3365820 RepID=UPI00380DDAF5